MSKKFFYVAALLAGLVFTGTSCADDKGDNDDDDDDAIDLDYTASNANSWVNYMVNVASLLKKDAEDLYNYWYIITFLKKRQKLFVSGGTQMVRTNTFNKEEFKKDIKDNCKLLYRKNIEE